MSRPQFKTLEELLASPDVDPDNKRRAYSCWNRRRSVNFAKGVHLGEEPEPLCEGDEVTVVGLMTNKSLNNCTGVLGSFVDGRWEIPALSARVKPFNLVKKQWLYAGRYNSSIVFHGIVFTVQINDDKSLRFLDKGSPAHKMKMLRLNTPWSWDDGYNEAQPELSDLSA